MGERTAGYLIEQVCGFKRTDDHSSEKLTLEEVKVLLTETINEINDHCGDKNFYIPITQDRILLRLSNRISELECPVTEAEIDEVHEALAKDWGEGSQEIFKWLVEHNPLLEIFHRSESIGLLFENMVIIFDYCRWWEESVILN